MRKAIALPFLFLVIVQIGISQDSTKVLFIGNSYTYFWNLPQVVQAMAVSQEAPIMTAQSTAGGSNLGQHWKGEKGLRSHDVLSSNNWSHVVLQDHSLRTIQAPDSLTHYITSWHNEIEEIGAQTLLYMTWARKHNPIMQKTISQGYREVGSELNVPVVPVGEIWYQARNLRPDLPLYDPDESHPAPLGTYITALAFYKALTGQSLEDIPTRLTSTDIHGQPLYLLIVNPNDAKFCKDVVEMVMSK